ncbi:XdhC family protein [Cupriavidus consociatus]|uniref:XdhC family protein n=1 Tax=Cupriavidus consociatus TaxID=2821357 RepID=UPI001AE15DBF|nr:MULTISPECIES: XdhC family protein [unclassified Cupriavidus]MBP0618784.1 XdhC family protein [Cupriavidus sp. LEh25]MDK2655425.1 XdhC family protein [Cupriavidus sp. LEh21]
MESVDLEVLRSSVRWSGQGHRSLLVTVVRTWGSSPRPAGAMLAVRDDGLVVGSVSGGCIEDDIIDQTRREGIRDGRPKVLRYGVSAEEAHHFGLPCGGTIELVAEAVCTASGLRELLQAVEDGRLVTRTLDVATGVATLGPAAAADGLAFDGRFLSTIHGPRYRMLVIGAGQLSKYLCEIAVGLGFDVTVCDPREEYSDAWTLPGITMVRTMPDDTVMEMALDERSAVVALTHDPKLDDLALMEALRTPAFYVGALGSRRNNQARRERLKEFDLNSRQLARLHGPAGIYIGSRTPPEIAISILAEVVAARNQVRLPDDLKVEQAKSLREIPADTISACGISAGRNDVPA